MYLGYRGDRVIDAVEGKASNLLLDMLTMFILGCLQSESPVSSHRLFFSLFVVYASLFRLACSNSDFFEIQLHSVIESGGSIGWCKGVPAAASL